MDELEQKWMVEERPFVSQMPVLGRLIVAIRTVWNNVSTRWYVLPLLHQQNEVNRQLVNQLREQWQLLEMQQNQLIITNREQSELIHDIGLLQVQLRQLQQQITELTIRLENPNRKL